MVVDLGDLLLGDLATCTPEQAGRDEIADRPSVIQDVSADRRTLDKDQQRALARSLPKGRFRQKTNSLAGASRQIQHLS